MTLQAKLVEKPGYHLREIPRGQIGTITKILEEVLELQDAWTQSCRIMVLLELSDLYGAIEAFLKAVFSDMTMTDVRRMAGVTRRAFENGARS